jgi:hypothetical protein
MMMKTGMLLGFVIGLAIGVSAGEMNWEGTHRIVSCTQGRSSFSPQKCRTVWTLAVNDGKLTGKASPFGMDLRGNDHIKSEELTGTIQAQVIEWRSTRSGENANKQKFTCMTVFHGVEDEDKIVGYFEQTWAEEGQSSVTYRGVVDLKRADEEQTFKWVSDAKVGGVVRDPGGKPAPGLSVWLHPAWPHRDIKTDADGRYEFVPDDETRVVLAVDAIRNLAASRELEDGMTNLDLQLAPAQTVIGRVEDSQGRPIPNANAQVYLYSGQWGFPVYWQPVTTDAQGCYKAVHLPADRAYYINFGARGYGSAQQKVPAENGLGIELPPVVLKEANRQLIGQVVDASETPVADASIHVSGHGQPSIDVQTDPQGRFALEVCEGQVSFSVHHRELYANVRAEAGDTNVVVVLRPESDRAENGQPKRASLVGKALPGLTGLDLSNDALPAGKPLLLCLFDCDQRPSRQTLRLLGEPAESLRQKGVTILGIQAAVVTDESFNRWKEANPVPFKIGRLTEKLP